MTKFFIDCEFIDNGKTIGFCDSGVAIDLISIGIACEDGRELYLQSVEFDSARANEWMKENVFPHLQKCEIDRFFSDDYIYEGPNANHAVQCQDRECLWRSREQIRDEIRAFIDVGHEYLADNGNPELWGWRASYDFVAFCQLFGTMKDLPSGYPHYIKDLQYILDERGISDDQLPEQEIGQHHALEEARHLKKLWGYIVRNDAWQ